jgi:hypothetical protein
MFAWMRSRTGSATGAPSPNGAPRAGRRAFAHRRFALLAGAFLLIFTAAAPLYLQSTNLLNVAAFIARAAAAALRLLGLEARATENLLWTSRGSFLVTQECISTPLIPIYLAAVLALGGTWRSRLPALLAAAPLFVGLGIARLLVVALPVAFSASPIFLIHAFFQISWRGHRRLAALWRHPTGDGRARRAFLGWVFLCSLGPTSASSCTPSR